jgi:hypothetical protein
MTLVDAVDRDRLVDMFLELVAIDSPTGHESLAVAAATITTRRSRAASKPVPARPTRSPSGRSRSALLLALMSGAGMVLAVLMDRHRAPNHEAVHLAAAAAEVRHTIPTEAVTISSTAR